MSINLAIPNDAVMAENLNRNIYVGYQKIQLTEPTTGTIVVKDLGVDPAHITYHWIYSNSDYTTFYNFDTVGGNSINVAAIFPTAQQGDYLSLGIDIDPAFSPFLRTINFYASAILDADIGLPVTFGNILANLKNGMINLKWTTIAEQNNLHFDVEVSIDGKTFKKIQTIQSKAKNGFSNRPIDYEYSFEANSIASLLGIPSILALFLLSISPKSKGKYWTVKSVLAIIAMSAIGFACSKKDTVIPTTAAQKVFIRIAQVDNNGKKVYSKVVQVANQ